MRILSGAIAPLVCLSLATPAAAKAIAFPNFQDVSRLTLVGAAAQAQTSDGTVLRLVPALGSEVGGAILKKRIPLGSTGAFSATFRFRITSPGGDGFALVLARKQDRIAVDNGGGGLGYNDVRRSVGITFDTLQDVRDPGSNQITIERNGAVSQHIRGSYGFVYGVKQCSGAGQFGCLKNGDVWTVHVAYDGTTMGVTVQDGAATPTAVVAEYPIDVLATTGSPDLFLALTASTGAATENVDILDLQFVTKP